MARNKEPLVCTSNSHNHIDYGIPIVANKSTDYRTTTGNIHDYVPPKPDDFDCRVKVNLRGDWKFQDIAQKNFIESTHRNDFVTKYTRTKACDNYEKAPNRDKDYTRTVEETMFANPPRPISSKISEMKDNYRINYANLDTREVIPPAISAICPVRGLGRDEQPPVRPEKEGFWKWLDPYMTTNKSTHVQFSRHQYNVAKQDFPTYYNTYGMWPGFDDMLPPASGNKTIIDNAPFKYQLPNRNLPKIVKRVPNSGITTEYNSNYQINSKSDLAPYMQAAGEEFPESLAEASAWQNLAAPGMYRTEYCQLGTTKSARSVIAMDKSKHPFVHKQCRIKLTDNYYKG